ncbi:hypothetical protein L210DRAFT_3470011 [Boletus edulis BED1]|uniref:C2H2-type domain-containing protein n=1 Tax=Boletus edulis BED1 TaxID=1328754 RepID=A0AAD4C7Q1_BOLED|nr:hypothetical protein L210DRAFT_3470011 [Boletus edulis BED1]
MKHHRNPTHSYPQNTAPLSIHASLALRHPTLLSPLRPIANTLLPGNGDALDDFQSNAWVSAPSYRSHLAGLGINYLRDTSANLHGQPLAPEDSALRMQVDGDEELLYLPPDPHVTDAPPDDFPGPTVPYRGSGSAEDHRMAQCTPSFVPSLGEESTACLYLGLDSDINPTASDIVGLIPDVNMYDNLRRLDLSHPGINPLDTICSSPLHDVGISHEEPLIDDLPPTTDARAEQSPSPRVIQDIMSILVRPVPEFSFPPWPSANPPFAQSFSPSQLAAPGSSLSAKPEPTTVPDSGHHASPASCNLQYPGSTHSSPILNAHLGIELNELVSRAERFKTKYPERDIDRAWLSHFAGKLSDRGELLNDFRCYIVGCDQRNKRRDHILVHVGAHIGQRPFACSVPLRFLRKNECKRHEASHTGFRPYSCDICGQSFVRQDLVKRHVKRTHGLQDENDSGVGKQPRKRARLQ